MYEREAGHGTRIASLRLIRHRRAPGGGVLAVGASGFPATTDVDAARDRIEQPR